MKGFTSSNRQNLSCNELPRVLVIESTPVSWVREVVRVPVCPLLLAVAAHSLLADLLHTHTHTPRSVTQPGSFTKLGSKIHHFVDMDFTVLWILFTCHA